MALFARLLSLLPLDGWKSVIAYLLLNIPHDGSAGILLDAVQKSLANPSAANVAQAVLQAGLALFLAHRAAKNVVGS